MTRATGHDRTVPDAGTVSYVYAVCRGDAAPSAADVPGHDGNALRLVAHGGLAAVVASLPADEYAGAGLEARLQDLGRLERLARSHNAVVDAYHARTTVLPMRLATVYLDDGRVERMLAERADIFDRALERLSGHVELGVKVYATPPGAPTGEERAVPEPDTGESPGRAYLRRRQAGRRRRRDAYRTAGEVAARLPATAGPFASARGVHRPQQGELASHAGENIANEAYLVPRAEADAFRTAVSELAEGVAGVHIEVTGPWAPYSFADSAFADGGSTPGANA